MATTDWTTLLDPNGASTTNAQAYKDSKSWVIKASSSEPLCTILDKSDTDAPSEGRIITANYNLGAGNNGFGFAFRLQDKDNFYHVWHSPGNGYWRFNYIEAGAKTQIDQIDENNIPANQWYLIRFTFYENSGSVYARVEWKHPSDSSWTLSGESGHGGNKWSGGGACGLSRTTSTSSSNEDSFYDETEVFY